MSGSDEATADPLARTTLSPAVATVARDLAVALHPAPDPALPAGAAFTFTLTADGNETQVDCSMSGEPWSCTSASDTASLSPGSKLALELTPSGTAAGRALPFRFGWRATTP